MLAENLEITTKTSYIHVIAQKLIDFIGAVRGHAKFMLDSEWISNSFVHLFCRKDLWAYALWYTSSS